MQLTVSAPNGQVDGQIARDLAPPGFDLVEAAAFSPDFNAAIPGAHYLVGLGDPRMNDAFYAASPHLKLVQLLSAGYDRCDIDSARRARVPIADNGAANSVPVAEPAVMLILATARRLVWQHTSVASGIWRGNDWQNKHVFELSEKTLGIIGLGTIGKKVARIARAFGMNVQYYDIARLTEDQEDSLGVRFRLFDEILKTSDLVTLHVPLLPTTRHLIGARELGLMKPHAYLINTCRGPVVDEAALTQALVNNTIAGAGLDVFDQEPPPADNPLFKLDNVILTPHLAGPTFENRAKRFRNAFDNVQRVARGQNPFWVIPELKDLLP